MFSLTVDMFIYIYRYVLDPLTLLPNLNISTFKNKCNKIIIGRKKMYSDNIFYNILLHK